MIIRQKYLVAAGLIVLSALIVLTCVLQHYGGQKPAPPKPMVGFLLQGDVQDGGWTSSNYRGVMSAAEAMDIQIDVRNDVAAGSDQLAAAIDDMKAGQEKLVFLASSDYGKDMRALQARSPKQIFAIPALEQPDSGHMISYALRLYQAEYLAGILAGQHSRTERIGYVASTPLPEVIRCIDAFTLGVQRVKPQARVIVYWIGSWNDEAREEQATAALVEQAGTDIINSHQDCDYVQRTAARLGAGFFGYQEKVEGAEEHELAVVVSDWAQVYRMILQDYQRERLKSSYWLGIPEKAVGLAELSPQLTEVERQSMEQAERDLAAGSNVFSGEIRDAQGQLRCAEDESITDETLINMDWYVEGVSFYD
jgi:basic membrane protein A